MAYIVSYLHTNECGNLVAGNQFWEGEIHEFLAERPDVGLLRYDFVDTGADTQEYKEVRAETLKTVQFPRSPQLVAVQVLPAVEPPPNYKPAKVTKPKKKVGEE